MTAPLMSVDEALDFLLSRATPLTGRDTVMLDDALGRVLVEPLSSSIAVPPLDNSAMDGYAVRAAELGAGGTRMSISQRIPAGTVGEPLQPGTVARIFTGAPVPPGADAVVMQEETTQTGDSVVFQAGARPGQNIRRAGEDIMPGTVVLQAGTRLDARHLGLAASVGIHLLPVYRKLRVATFFTGDELVMPGRPLGPGQIYNSNRYTLQGLLHMLGCDVIDLGIVPDRLDATVAVLRQAAQHADVILTSGGVSVGEEDHVKAAVEQLGEINMWRIAMKPGKPLAFGQIDNAAFIGLPGNPVSVFVTFCIFARPFLLRMQGVQAVAPRVFNVTAGFDWQKPDRRQEFLRARLEPDSQGAMQATIFANQGSGVLTSTVWGEGLIDVPAGTPIKRGESVRFLPFSGLFA